METYKPQPLEERKSQSLNFWDFTKEKLFWGVLPLLTAGGAILIGKATKFKIWPLDGSPDLLSTLYAKGTKFFTKKHDIKGGEAAEKWIKDGAWVGQWITELGGNKTEILRKHYFNFVKGAEIAVPFSAYFLWGKKEGNRLDLEEAGDKIKKLRILKPSDEEIAVHNEAMRREVAFAARSGDTPAVTIDKTGIEYHGKLAELQKSQSM